MMRMVVRIFQDDAFNDGFVGDDVLEEKKGTGKEGEDGDEDEADEVEAGDELGKAEEDVKWKEMEEDEQSPDARIVDMVKKHDWIKDYFYDPINHRKCRLTLAVIQFDFQLIFVSFKYFFYVYRFLLVSPKSICRCP